MSSNNNFGQNKKLDENLASESKDQIVVKAIDLYK
jgi:hypothetical protein